MRAPVSACDKARQRRTKPGRPPPGVYPCVFVCLFGGTDWADNSGLSWCLQTSDKDMSFMSECLGAGLPSHYIATSAAACATVLAYPYPPDSRAPTTPSNHRTWIGRYAPPCFALFCSALLCFALPCLALPCIALPCLALPCLANARSAARRRRHSAATAEELLARGQQEDGDHRRSRRCVRIVAAARS